MNELIQMLDKIYELLEQISGITANQTTILLEARNKESDKQQSLDMIETMADYKDQLMNTLTESENNFEKAYAPYKGKINEAATVALFKEKVGRILNIKNDIVDAERNNVTIMGSLSQRQDKKLVIAKSNSEVTAAYKKQQIKS